MTKVSIGIQTLAFAILLNTLLSPVVTLASTLTPQPLQREMTQAEVTQLIESIRAQIAVLQKRIADFEMRNAATPVKIATTTPVLKFTNNGISSSFPWTANVYEINWGTNIPATSSIYFSADGVTKGRLIQDFKQSNTNFSTLVNVSFDPSTFYIQEIGLDQQIVRNSGQLPKAIRIQQYNPNEQPPQGSTNGNGQLPQNKYNSGSLSPAHA